MRRRVTLLLQVNLRRRVNFLPQVNLRRRVNLLLLASLRCRVTHLLQISLRRRVNFQLQISLLRVATPSPPAVISQPPHTTQLNPGESLSRPYINLCQQIIPVLHALSVLPTPPPPPPMGSRRCGGCCEHAQRHPVFGHGESGWRRIYSSRLRVQRAGADWQRVWKTRFGVGVVELGVLIRKD